MTKNDTRVFLIVMDSLGIGALPDAMEYGDEGSNTLDSIIKSKLFDAPTLANLGLFNIDSVNKKFSVNNPLASFARLAEKSKGKDTTIGHWEIAGVVSDKAMPTYPNGFPKNIIEEFKKRTGRGVLCNKTYSGTQVIKDYGEEHMRTGDLIVYTSADSVFQVAAHEEIVPIEQLYQYCKVAREIMTGKHAVGRIIARPFLGKFPNFHRTSNRHDFSLLPPKKTMLDILSENNFETISVGKINDIFAGQGVSQSFPIKNNNEGMKITQKWLNIPFGGLCFVNLVDFDMLYGHRNDIDGYANAVTVFDIELNEFVKKMNNNDILIITADHGCDPAMPSTDHSREYVPMLIYGNNIKKGVNLGTRKSFSDIATTILDIFALPKEVSGESFYNEVYNEV